MTLNDRCSSHMSNVMMMIHEYDDVNEVVQDRLGNKYFKRRDDQIYARNFGGSDTNRPVILTTTEMLAAELAFKTYPNAKFPDLLADERLSAGEAYLMGSEHVGSKRDGILPMVVDAVNEVVDRPYTLIGNGVGSDTNLSNTKGQNSFRGENLVIKVSCPNVAVLRQYTDLEFFGQNQRMIAVCLMLDDLHQAIGRSGGNRYIAGTHMICMVPDDYVEDIEEYSRYQFASTEILTNDSNHVFDPVKQQTIIEFIKAVQDINVMIYKKRFEYDIKRFTDLLTVDYRRYQFYSRMIHFYKCRIKEGNKKIADVGVSKDISRKDKEKVLKSLKYRLVRAETILKYLEKVSDIALIEKQRSGDLA